LAIFQRENIFAQRAKLALLTGGGFFLFGWGGIMIWGGNAHSSSPIWPATAFALCIILRLSRSRADDVAMVASILPAGILANLLGGAPWPATLGFAVINMLDVCAGLLATRHLKVPRFTTTATAVKFFTAAAISPSVFGAILAFLLITALGGDGKLAGVQWLLSNVLGVCILFPFGMTVSMRQLSKLKLANRLLEAVIVFGSVAATAVLADDVVPVSLQFLVLATTIIAATRFRLLGAGAALAIIGAVALTSPQDKGLVRIEMLQFFLAVCSIVSVRTATLLNERDVHIAVIERRRLRAVRAPLSAVIGFSGMLETGALAADRAPEFASIIVHNGELLQRLHDDLLDLSRAESGALSILPERVKLVDAVFASVGGIRLTLPWAARMC
jgi:integral membrane sensor domain MASE1